IDEYSGLIEISTQDRPGLLAAVTGTFAARQIDIVDASTVLWADGAVVESFTVRSAAPFRTAIGATGALDAEITRRFREPPTSEAMPDLEIEYDNDASPWYTLCEVRGQDRPGVLHTITVGFSSAGVTVHSARIETIGGVAIDHFELSDTDGRKLSPEM